MNSKPIVNKFNTINSLLLAIIFCLLVLSIILHPKVADDFCLSASIHNSTGFKEYIVSYYNSINGRLFSGVLYYVFFYSTVSTIFCKVISAVLFYFIVLYACKLLLGKTYEKKDFYFWFSLVYSVIWFGFSCMNEAVYWSNASVVYLWGLSFFLFYIAVYLKFIFSNDSISELKEQNKFALYTLPFVSLVAGCIQEQLLLPATLTFAFFIIKYYKANKLRQLPVTLYFGVVGFYIGFGAMVFSPANIHRAISTIGVSNKTGISISQTLFRIFDYVIHAFIQADGSGIIPWLLLSLFCVLFFYKGSVKWKQNTPFLLFGLMALGAILPILLTGCKNTSSRTYFYFSFFLLLSILSLVSIDKTQSGKRIGLFTCLLLCIISIDTFNSVRSSYYYFKQNSDREKEISKSIKEGDHIIDLVPFYAKLHRTMYVKDVNLDKDDRWINKCVCEYYKVDSINVTENKPK